jgi:hypothetical protein
MDKCVTLETVTFLTIDNAQYEDMSRKDKIEFQAEYRMFAIHPLIDHGKWILMKKEDCYDAFLQNL